MSPHLCVGSVLQHHHLLPVYAAYRSETLDDRWRNVTEELQNVAGGKRSGGGGGGVEGGI